jgi:hypothetical protein
MTNKPTRMLLGLAIVLTGSFAIAAQNHDCEALKNSALAEPEWYLEECLHGIPPAAPAVAHGPWRVPGDTQYIHNVRAAGTFPQSLVTAPIPTLNYTLVGPNVRPIFAVDFDVPANVLWGIDNTTRELGTYNLATGVFTPTVVTTGITGTITGLKFDHTNGLVYVSSATNLFTLNTTTGVATQLPSSFSPFVLVIDIAISPTGQMYGQDIGVDQLISINKATGAATAIGPTGQNTNFAQGMDFDTSDNTLYAYMYLGGGVNNLSTFNLATGAATIIVNGPAGPENEGSMDVPAVPVSLLGFGVE